ncbi:SgcJ/EcaC family oxidoreductase [Marinobacter nanhaiticus D15-8W]|uniref:SgcJ/EcaC family oxidoreductase n=1 Tax=Marinobacter nanhaiticus D15-8W TaxID=626887 RepID=N6WWX8_9GAMM|nr:SgcJ/EcaC family oxidoreductase [Marinobacter nanhaiticus]ENO15577.1 SgcJ/EcaC family oxidoreductase [Marinobacter nanhaiticus D15-8W]BES73573.1 SgcJ/EcaC family oxidoreductase [Marinobacter nanhaiticus D15-8W]
MADDEQAIRQLVRTWIDATREGDIDAVLSLMADDVVFLVAGQPPMVGKETFAKAAREQSEEGLPDFDGTSEIEEIQVIGDWAYMWTTLSVTVTPPGDAPTMKRAGNTLSVLRKENGRWLLARDANMLVPIEED